MALTNTQIAEIKRAAVLDGDWPVVAICERALGAGRYELRAPYPLMTDDDTATAQAMTQEEAAAWCEDVRRTAQAVSVVAMNKIAASFAQSTPILDWFRRAKG